LDRVMDVPPFCVALDERIKGEPRTA
jgi:hypothetical protein